MRRVARAQTPAFVFRLDSHSGIPVYRQIVDQVQAAIARGVLAVGDQLPTVRQVAVDLVINPNTVARAYREMEIRGTLARNKVWERSSPTNRSNMRSPNATGSLDSWLENSYRVPALQASLSIT